jgi:hypothetical protein
MIAKWQQERRRGRPIFRSALALGAVILLAGCTTSTLTTTPSPQAVTPSPSPVASVNEIDTVYPLAPPQAVQAWLARNVQIRFRPLTPRELGLVTISVADAERLALADPGMGYGPGSAHVTWSKTGCAYLGYYVAPHMPSIGYVPPEYIAYVVQTLAPPVTSFPGINVGIVVIDATSGAMGTRYGSGSGPILGTTCGAKT